MAKTKLSVSDATLEVISTLFPHINTKAKVIDTFVRKDVMTGEDVISPVPVTFSIEQAQYLVSINGANRAVSSSSTVQYHIAFEKNTFVRTGDCFMITDKGELVNGGCRSTSFVTTYKKKQPRYGLPCFLLIEVTHEVVLVSDQARRRNTSAQLMLACGLQLDSIMEGVTKKCWFNKKEYTSGNRKNLGMTEYKAYAESNYKDLAEFSSIIREFNHRTGLDKQSVWRPLFLIWRKDKRIGREFINQFYTDEGYNDLRLEIINGKFAENPIMYMILANAYVDLFGKNVSKATFVDFYSEL